MHFSNMSHSTYLILNKIKGCSLYNTFVRSVRYVLGFLKSYCNKFDQNIARQRLVIQFPTHNNVNCVSVDECYSSLLVSSQRANKLAG
jgi:hypothetical protein